ncbi:serine/threonine-protein kinase [Sorangium sp. So ce1335]|uniref:serine/threonine-protein kinase n=1 Tax=Sorangium sp. So ce1335 TaxID=3133335 RepID=UPI003F5E7099
MVLTQGGAPLQASSDGSASPTTACDDTLGGALRCVETCDAPASSGRPQMLPRGSRVGDYVVEQSIAHGSFGVVYQAAHAESGKRAAVKVLHPELLFTREAVVRFEREIQAIRRIDHPNVIRILDCGQMDGGRPFFAMELLSGVDLQSYISSRGRLSAEDTLEILEPVCEALSAVHRSAIVHRDLKASNVFIAQENCVPRVVLLDFGVAKVLDDAGPGITAPTHLLGTPACMAPEQIRGQRADARTDVYALGALAYYMVTGKLPFLDATLATLLHMHLWVHPPSPSREAPVGPEVDEVVLRAMAKDPAQRYQTAAEFIEGLRAAVAAGRTSVLPLPGSPEERRVGAVHVEVLADCGAMEDPDDALLADMDDVLPLASRFLSARGFTAALETGNSLLFFRELAAPEASDRASRRDIVDTALLLERELRHRKGRDARVHVNVCLHAGQVLMRASEVVGGELMDVAAWAPEIELPGVTATQAMLDGLDLDAELLECAPALRRVARGAGRTRSR